MSASPATAKGRKRPRPSSSAIPSLTIVLARMPIVTARAVTIGILANTIVKLGIALLLGRGRFRPLAVAGLALMAGALGGGALRRSFPAAGSAPEEPPRLGATS